MPSRASATRSASPLHSSLSSASPRSFLLLLLALRLPSLTIAFFPALPTSSLTAHSQNNQSPSATSHTIALSGGLLHTSNFYFHALVGGHNLSLQVDISYASLIVPRKGCVGCRVGDSLYDPASSAHAAVVPCADPRCAPKTDHCNPKSCSNCAANGHCCVEDSSDCAFNMFYGDGSSGNGTLLTDTFAVGKLKADVMLGAMHRESHNFELPYADGAFGLAFQRGACHPACVPPLMDALVEGAGIGNVFTMCVSRFGGTLVLGQADEELADRGYQYVDFAEVADDDRFTVPAQSEWKVGTRSLAVPAVTAAMWSTGVTDIAVSKSTFLALLSHLTEHYCRIDGLCSMTSWFRPQRCTAIPDASVAQMPNITMGLSRGVSITLTPDDYLVKYRVVDGEQHRCVAFIATDSLAKKGIGLLLGTTVMRRYAVVFDRGARRVGIAPAKPDKCGPDTGSERGMPGGGRPGDAPVLTADAPPVPGANTVGADTELGKRLLNAELCRAEETCSGCAALGNCSFGYQSGKCVPMEEGGKRPYPYCSGMTCACFAVGGGAWYVGAAIGVLLVAAVAGGAMVMWRKRQRRNQYAMVQPYEEQDLETF